MATVRLIPSAYSVSNSSYVQVTNPSNMYHNTDNTTYATLTSTRASTTSYYVYIKGFNFSTAGIPDDAIINSITIKVKGYESGLSTSTSYAPRLYNNTSTISEASAASTTFGTSTKTIEVPHGSLTYSDLKGYGTNLGIRVTVRRSSSNTQGYLYIYGAEILVDYTERVYHNITINNSTSATVTASDTNPLEGSDVEIIADTLSGLTITDNGVDVTSQFVQGASDTVSAVPGSYTTGGSINGTNYQSTIGKGSDTANRTGNDYYSTSQGGSGSTYIDYHFDFSEIPTGANILSVSLTVKGHCESTSESREISRVQAYSGSTAKGSYTDMTDSTTDKVYTLSVGTWTAAELHDAVLKHTIGVYGGLVSGATWTVSYEVDGYVYTISNVIADHTIVVTSGGVTQQAYIKVNGSWVAATKVYKKVSGSWVEQSDLTQVFDSGTNYKLN